MLDPERDWANGAFDGYSRGRRGRRFVASAERLRGPRSSMICARSRRTAIRRHDRRRGEFWVCGFDMLLLLLFFFFFFTGVFGPSSHGFFGF